MTARKDNKTRLLRSETTESWGEIFLFEINMSISLVKKSLKTKFLATKQKEKKEIKVEKKVYSENINILLKLKKSDKEKALLKKIFQ
jgi:hypothetical protein